MKSTKKPTEETNLISDDLSDDYQTKEEEKKRLIDTKEYTILPHTSINTPFHEDENEDENEENEKDDRKKFLKIITLTKGTLPIHFFTFMVCIMITIICASFIVSADAYILTVYLNIPTNRQGTILGNLSMVIFFCVCVCD